VTLCGEILVERRRRGAMGEMLGEEEEMANDSGI
jgi:hypothetical protein